MFQYYYILLMYYALMIWLERAGTRHSRQSAGGFPTVLLENVDRKNE